MAPRNYGVLSTGGLLVGIVVGTLVAIVITLLLTRDVERFLGMPEVLTIAVPSILVALAVALFLTAQAKKQA